MWVCRRLVIGLREASCICCSWLPGVCVSVNLALLRKPHKITVFHKGNLSCNKALLLQSFVSAWQTKPFFECPLLQQETTHYFTATRNAFAQWVSFGKMWMVKKAKCCANKARLTILQALPSCRKCQEEELPMCCRVDSFESIYER